MAQIRRYSDGVTHRKPNGVKLRPTGALTITPQAQVERNVIVLGIGQPEPNRNDRPTCVQRDDGVWVMVYRQGTHHYIEMANDLVHIKFLKPDGTWTADDTYLDDTSVSGLPSEASPGDSLGPSDPTIIKAPNGDLIIHTWDIDYSGIDNGTHQVRSTDGGKTWGAWSGPINWVGLPPSIITNEHVYAAEDFFIYAGIIYLIARYYTNAARDAAGGIFCKSQDNGQTWEYVSQVVPATYSTKGGVEFSLEYIGGTRLVSTIRDYARDYTWVCFSDDFGVTWGTPARIDTQLGANLYRARTYTDSHLKGRDNWWNDSLVLNNGWTNDSGGSSMPRRPGIALSNDKNTSFSAMYFVDDFTEDCGYGDLYFNPATGNYGFITYYGTADSTDVVQYLFDVEW